jgi:hypothetical protein
MEPHKNEAFPARFAALVDPAGTGFNLTKQATYQYNSFKTKI